jgi:hypothetical protein
MIQRCDFAPRAASDPTGRSSGERRRIAVRASTMIARVMMHEMRRVLRTVLIAVTVLSALACVATVALWARSYTTEDVLRVSWTRKVDAGAADDQWRCRSNRGELLFVSRHIAINHGGGIGRFLRQVAEETRERPAWSVRSGPSTSEPWPVAGGWGPVRWGGDSDASTDPGDSPASVHRFVDAYSGLAVWNAIPASAFAGPPVVALLRYRRRRAKRLAPHGCPSCGYGCRATPDRCPECGAAPHAKAARPGGAGG